MAGVAAPPPPVPVPAAAAPAAARRLAVVVPVQVAVLGGVLVAGHVRAALLAVLQPLVQAAALQVLPAVTQSTAQMSKNTGDGPPAPPMCV